MSDSKIKISDTWHMSSGMPNVEYGIWYPGSDFPLRKVIGDWGKLKKIFFKTFF